VTKKKLLSIAIDSATFAAMTDYATSSGLPLPELVKRMWSLWMTVDSAHGTLYPHQRADGQLDTSLENFLTEMQEQADHFEEDPCRDKLTGQFVAGSNVGEESTEEKQELVQWLNDTDVEYR
jgi:hypothetical protein